MQMGAGVKFLTAVDRRFWLDSDLAPGGIDDTIGETWEGSDNQTEGTGQEMDLSVFAGGEAAKRALAQDKPADWYAQSLGKLYEGYEKHRVRTEFVAWPKEKHTMAGYSCPGKNQVTGVAPFYTKPYQGKLIFAGEHTCPAFFGYMEGALESGLLATGQIAFARGLLPEDWAVNALKAAIAPWTP